MRNGFYYFEKRKDTPRPPERLLAFAKPSAEQGAEAGSKPYSRFWFLNSRFFLRYPHRTAAAKSSTAAKTAERARAGGRRRRRPAARGARDAPDDNLVTYRNP